jgi:hypothetical protein
VIETRIRSFARRYWPLLLCFVFDLILSVTWPASVNAPVARVVLIRDVVMGAACATRRLGDSLD